ncbi:MAG: 50S ribosomal protein L25/general stress protein Ctc [Desulfobacteraceae bacterium 4572_130]|nr:MAG: 50S ribosomal protein L25/general stress protein Ctc [Desulfobacteraceae bacterium 4572_130]
MELVDLKVEIRQKKGKNNARDLRRKNIVPGILYGPNTEPVMLSISNYDIDKIIRENGSTGVFLNLIDKDDTRESRTVMLKELQMDTFNLNYLHIDFQEIDIEEKVTIRVPVQTTGESKGIKEGGVVSIIRRELNVICTPQNLPDTITIDITNLDIGDSVHVKEIDLGENVEIPHDVNFTVLTVLAPTIEKEKEDELDEEEEILEEDVKEDTKEPEADSKK